MRNPLTAFPGDRRDQPLEPHGGDLPAMQPPSSFQGRGTTCGRHKLSYLGNSANLDSQHATHNLYFPKKTLVVLARRLLETSGAKTYGVAQFSREKIEFHWTNNKNRQADSVRHLIICNCNLAHYSTCLPQMTVNEKPKDRCVSRILHGARYALLRSRGILH